MPFRSAKIQFSLRKQSFRTPKTLLFQTQIGITEPDFVEAEHHISRFTFHAFRLYFDLYPASIPAESKRRF